MNAFNHFSLMVDQGLFIPLIVTRFGDIVLLVS